MTDTPADTTPATFLDRLREATNAHDVDALVSCFRVDYRNETPAHPTRGFTGRGQVRANWTQIFTSIPDVHAEVQASVVDGDQVWSDWEMTGTRLDGSQHHMRGVIVFGVQDGRAGWARFYLEPVDPGDADHPPVGISEAVRQQVHADGSSS